MRRFSLLVRRFILVSTLIGLAAGCSESVSDSAPTVAQAPTTTTAASQSTDWRERVSADVASFQREDSAGYETVANLRARKTRAGHLRLTNAVLDNPKAASVLLARLSEQRDDAAVRAAVAEALPRTGGHYADAVADLLELESDAQVRTALVGTLRRAGGTEAVNGLRRGFTDRAPEVRAESARAAARLANGTVLADDLIASLNDGDNQVRAAAARTLGILGVAGAQDQLVALLASDDARVRLESIRSLGRISPDFVRTSPAVANLEKDSDERVRSAALRLRKGAINPAN